MTALAKPPTCPKCGGKARLEDDRFGGKYACCGMWSWGGKPLRTAAENKEARTAFKDRVLGKRTRKAVESDSFDLWGPARPGWALVLGLDMPTTIRAATAARNRLARTHHPDAGGSQERMAEVNAAFEAAKVALVDKPGEG